MSDLLTDKMISDISKNLRKLRLTDVYGRKEIPCETFLSVMKRGLGGHYDNAAIEYIVRAVLRYEQSAIKKQTQSQTAKE